MHVLHCTCAVNFSAQTSVTLLNAYDAKRESRASAEERLNSFFPEADRYRVCRRTLCDGDVVETVQHLHQTRRVDFVIAPSAKAPRWPWRTSLHSRLMKEAGVSLWTFDERVEPSRLSMRPRNIACWLDFESPKTQHLAVALDYALTVNATLHLLHVTPELNEGTLRAPSAPLHQEEVAAAVRDQVARSGILHPQIHMCASPRDLTKKLQHLSADLLFVSEAQALGFSLFGGRLGSLVRNAPCPALCVSDQTSHLRLEPGAAHRVFSPRLVRQQSPGLAQ